MGNSIHKCVHSIHFWSTQKNIDVCMACHVHYLSSPEIGRGQFNKGVSFIFIFTNPFSCYLALSVYVCVCVCVCVCLAHSFTLFLSVFIVLPSKDLHLYM